MFVHDPPRLKTIIDVDVDTNDKKKNNGFVVLRDLALIQQATLARTPVSGADDPRDAATGEELDVLLDLAVGGTSRLAALQAEALAEGMVP